MGMMKAVVVTQRVSNAENVSIWWRHYGGYCGNNWRCVIKMLFNIFVDLLYLYALDT